MAAQKDKNLFASPWKDSDLVLVVEGKKLNVHRWILTFQSPFFKAMLEGSFKEANQDIITLEEKDYESMVQFLKILYPRCMFAGASTPLDDDNLMSILALGDEYQCINVIKQCIDEAEITPENVLQILPYAMKYHEPALPKLFDVVNWSAPTAKLEEMLLKLDDKQAKDVSIKMLLTKCRLLESSVVNMQHALISLVCDFLKQKKKTNDPDEQIPPEPRVVPHSLGTLTFQSNLQLLPSLQPPPPDPTTSINCSHCRRTIYVGQISSTKSCKNCKEEYKQKFIAPIPTFHNAERYFNMLRDGQDLANAVKL